MRLLKPVLLAMLVLAACRGIPRLDPDPVREESFSEGALSRFDAYSDGGNPWSVANGTLRGNGTWLQAVLIHGEASVRDGWVETRADSMDDGGLVLRFSGPESYYLLAIRDDGAPGRFPSENLEIYEKSGPGQGGFRSLWQGDVAWPRGTARDVRFEAEADSLRVYVDGTRAGAVAVPRSTGTRIGVRHYGSGPQWTTRYRRLRWMERQ